MHFVAAYSPMILQKVRRFLSVALSTQPTNTNLSNFLADPSIHMVEKARIIPTGVSFDRHVSIGVIQWKL
jgi:hypothetical protein